MLYPFPDSSSHKNTGCICKQVLKNDKNSWQRLRVDPFSLPAWPPDSTYQNKIDPVDPTCSTPRRLHFRSGCPSLASSLCLVLDISSCEWLEVSTCLSISLSLCVLDCSTSPPPVAYLLLRHCRLVHCSILTHTERNANDSLRLIQIKMVVTVTEVSPSLLPSVFLLLPICKLHSYQKK
jgi:hypothetical protein